MSNSPSPSPFRLRPPLPRGDARGLRGVSARIFLAAALASLSALALSGGCRTVSIHPNSRDYEPPREMSALSTGYCNCKKCCDWQHTWYGRAVHAKGKLKGKPKKVGITASGTRARPGTIAADTSLFPFGTIIHVPGYGYGRVEDRGGAIKDRHIDLWFRRHGDALKWGRRQVKVKVWYPKGKAPARKSK